MGRIVGEERALWMVLFGECLSAEEALGAELTGVIVEADELPTTTTGKVQRRELRTGDED